MSCDQAETSDRREILPGLWSYSSASEVGSTLQAAGYTWRVIDERSNDPGDPRPAFTMLQWAVDRYRVSEFNGTLQLEFFNDRLVRATYYPDDPTKFQQEATKIGWADEGSMEVTRESGRVRVRRGTDHTGRSFFAFEDVHLLDELEAWVRRYSDAGRRHPGSC
jgi:hypothetical protein